MSILRAPLNAYLRLTEKRTLSQVEDHIALRRSLELKTRFLVHAPWGTGFENTMLGNIPALRVTPRVVADAAPLVLYFHGGGYVFGSPRTHRAMLGKLCSLTGGAALMPAYRLAPEHRFPAAIDDAVAAYKAVADHPTGVVIGGDSAGGGLALSVLAQSLKLSLPQPLGVFAFSPLTDMTFGGESVIRNAEAEVMLPHSRVGELADYYLAGADPADPRASPLFADFMGAPPVWLAVGDTEILLDDTRRMAAKLREQGVTVQDVIARDLPHVWPFFHNTLPEARATLRDVATWISHLSH